VIAGVIVLGYLVMGTVILWLYITKPKILSHERIADHIPDPRDTEIVFLRERVVHLENMLQGVQTSTADTMATMLRDHLFGTKTGLVLAEDGLVEEGGPDLGDLFEPDWTDDDIPDAVPAYEVPPPPVEFPRP